MFTPAEVLELGGGIADIARLRQHCSRKLIESALAAGQIQRLRKGHYALPELPEMYRTTILNRGTLSHQSAAIHQGMELLRPPEKLHVTLAPNRQVIARGPMTKFYFSRLVPADIDSFGFEVPVTSGTRTVLDCAATLPFDEALALADSAVRQNITSKRKLEEAAREYRCNGARAARFVVRHVDGGASNPFESKLRSICIEHGLSTTTTQFKVELSRSNAYIDVCDPQLKVALEAEGFEHHGHRKALHADCGRGDELVRQGWTLLRFSWEHVMFNELWVAEVIADTLAVAAARRRAPGPQVR